MYKIYLQNVFGGYLVGVAHFVVGTPRTIAWLHTNNGGLRKGARAIHGMHKEELTTVVSQTKKNRCHLSPVFPMKTRKTDA